MAKKRIKELAREHDMPPKEVIDRLVAAGLEVKGPASAVDEDQAKRALAGLPIEQTKRKTEIKRPATATRAVRPSQIARQAAEAEERERKRKEEAAKPATGRRPADPRRPTRSSLSGERAPGATGPGGKRRVVIDSQASRGPGGPGGGPGGPGRRGPR